MRRLTPFSTAAWLGLAVGCATAATANPPAPAISPVPAAHPTPRPNLVVIMTDDQGYADVGFHGCTDIPTPHIDALAHAGVIFSSGYVTYSVCGPSRAGFITGRYPQRFGFERNPQYKPSDPNMGLPLSERTIADVLGDIGYTSGIIGKWHLGAHPDLHPLKRGFDYFFGHLGGGHQYFQELLTIRNPHAAKNEAESYRTWIERNGEAVRIDKYLTDVFSDEAVSFIERHHAEPFFLFLAYNAPHTPMQAPDEYLNRFPDIQDPKRRTYAAMVSAVDDGVGRVLAALKAHGLDDNTLVFFLSDNGGPTSANASNNAPLRGAKSDVFDGGWRVPFALRWSGTLPAGQRFDRPVSAMDIFGTIAGITGVPVAAERPLDGVNLMPFLLRQQRGAPHQAVFLRKWDQKAYAIRVDDFKWVVPGATTSPRLFDARTDIGERINIAESMPKIVDQISALRDAWEAQLIEPQFDGLIMGRNPSSTQP
jgi:arylsulfatase A-like enzyme